MANINYMLKAFTPFELKMLNDILIKEKEEASSGGIDIPEDFSNLIENISRASQYAISLMDNRPRNKK